MDIEEVRLIGIGLGEGKSKRAVLAERGGKDCPRGRQRRMRGGWEERRRIRQDLGIHGDDERQ